MPHVSSEWGLLLLVDTINSESELQTGHRSKGQKSWYFNKFFLNQLTWHSYA